MRQSVLGKRVSSKSKCRIPVARGAMDIYKKEPLEQAEASSKIFRELFSKLLNSEKFCKHLKYCLFCQKVAIRLFVKFPYLYEKHTNTFVRPKPYD